MIESQLRHVGWLLLLLALQTFIFGHIDLYGYATPLVYVMFAARMRRGTGRAEALLWCFVMGLTVDVLALTPGLAAASMTLVGMAQPRLLEFMLPKDAVEDCDPGFKTLGGWLHTEYLIILIALHNTAYFCLEAFALGQWENAPARLLASTLLSLALILPMEKIREKP